MSPLFSTLILVGGLGARLQSVVNDRPKPMAVVMGRPFVEWILLSLRNQGVRNVIFCTCYMGDMVEGYFGDGKSWDMKIGYSHESSPLGTGGAVRLALEQVQEDRLLVLNGDSYCAYDLNFLLQAHTNWRSQTTIWLVHVDDCRRYGTVSVDEGGIIHAFREKSAILRAGTINSGVYLIERETAETLTLGETASLEADLFPRLAGRGLHGVLGNGPFLDIGVPEAYACAELFFRHHRLA